MAMPILLLKSMSPSKFNRPRSQMAYQMSVWADCAQGKLRGEVAEFEGMSPVIWMQILAASSSQSNQRC